MKVFWSWQSDHDGKISRHFIRDALLVAIKELKENPEIEEANRRELSLDQDRQGVPGSPDLASIILEKICNADVFVGDVTPVGQTKNGKPLINSNVGIELGFALKALGDRRLLMVMNETFGRQEDLPFDLRHKAGPVKYRLAEGATQPGRQKVQKQLAVNLKNALLDILKLHSQQKASATPFARMNAIPGDPARFWGPGVPLTTRHYASHEAPVNYHVCDGPLLYLRVTPTSQIQPVSRPEVVGLGRDSFPSFTHQSSSVGMSYANEFGAIAIDADHQLGTINAATQLFLSRELWAINWEFLNKYEEKCLPMNAVAATIGKTLPQMLKFSQEILEVGPPWQIEVGAYPVKGYRFGYCRPTVGRPAVLLFDDHICWKGIASDRDKSTIEDKTQEIIKTFFHAAALEMPLDFGK